MSAKTQRGSSKADTLMKFVLVGFISLLSFSVGTFVGKQVSDTDHRRLALEGEVKAEREIASTEEHGSGADERISEEEIESLTEEFVNKEKSAREPAEAAPTAAEPTAVTKHEAAPSQSEEGYKPYARGSAKAPAADAKAHEPTAPAAAPAATAGA